MLQVRAVCLILLQFNIVYGFLDVEFHNVSLESKSKKVKSCHAEIVTVDGEQVLNAHIEFNENIKVVNVNGSIDIIRDNKKYRMYDAVFDFCKALRARNNMNIVILIYNQFSGFGYMPHSCPFLAHINYTVTNFRVNTERLPIYTPRMDFIIDVKIYNVKEVMYQIVVTGIAESKSKSNITKAKIQ